MNILVVRILDVVCRWSRKKHSVFNYRFSREKYDVTILCVKQTRFKPSKQFTDLPDEIKLQYADSAFKNLPPF